MMLGAGPAGKERARAGGGHRGDGQRTGQPDRQTAAGGRAGWVHAVPPP